MNWHTQPPFTDMCVGDYLIVLLRLLDAVPSEWLGIALDDKARDYNGADVTDVD